MQQHTILTHRDGRFWSGLAGSENVSLFAKTRSGKGVCFVIPNCFHWKGSLVVLDIKGEAFRATAGHRLAMGQEVYLLNPAANRTHCWNPLSAVERHAWDAMDQISRMGFMLFPDSGATGPGGTGNSDKFWEPAGRAAYTAAATIIAETPGMSFDNATMLRLFARSDGGDVITSLINARRQASGTQYSQAAVDGVSSFLTGAPEQVEGIRTTVATRLQPWANPRTAAVSSRSDFDLRQLRRKPMTIYITINPADIPRYRAYLALFFEQLINLNIDVTPEQDDTIQYQALILLDEFARLGHMPTLAHAAQFSAGFGMRMAYVMQDTAQLEEFYGRAGARDIRSNSGVEIFFANNDLDTAKEVSERFGNTTVAVRSKNMPRFMSFLYPAKQTESEGPQARPWVLPQEVAMMPHYKQIMFRFGMPGGYTDRLPWYEDPKMVALVRDPPTIPEVKFDVPRDDGETRILRQDGLGETEIEAIELELAA